MQSFDCLKRDDYLWPHPASCLKKSEEKWAKLFLSGLRDSLGLPFVIGVELNYTPRIVRPNDPLKSYPDFCSIMRKKVPGGKELCKNSTINNMKKCIKEYKKSSNESVYEFKCHMGLSNFYFPLLAGNYIIGCQAAGKFLNEKCDEKLIINNIEKLKLSFNLHENLLKSLNKTSKNIKKINNNLRKAAIQSSVYQGFKSLNGIISNSYNESKFNAQRKKRLTIEDKLSRISLNSDFKESVDLERDLLKDACSYLGTEYILLFLSGAPSHKILDLEVHWGIEKFYRGDVHFNWKRTKIKRPYYSVKSWDFLKYKNSICKGFKGTKFEKIKSASYFYPFKIAGFEGALLIGPIKRDYDIDQEKTFLNSFCHAIGNQIAGKIIVERLGQKEDEKEKAVGLAAHMTRQGLHDILKEIDYIDLQCDLSPVDCAEIRGSTLRTKHYVELMTRRLLSALNAPEAVRALIPHLRESHLNFGPVTPATLIESCLDRYRNLAQKEKINIVADENSIDILPAMWADLDIIRLAFDNLFENAIKYTAPAGEINVTGYLNKENEKVGIEISNIGLEIKDSELKRVFDSGFRSEAAKSKKLKEGHGLGLDHVKQVLNLHKKATISIFNNRVNVGEWGFKTTIIVELPTSLSIIIGL